MATNPFQITDYLTEARDRVTQQFVGKDIFDRYLQLLVFGQAEVQETLKQLMQLRSIDTAEGVQLDNIGEIVGQPRELIQADLYEYFGMQSALNAQSFGEVGDTTVGGLFYSFGNPLGGNILLDDATYRKFIKAKIFKNTTASTPEEFLAVINLIFGTTSSALIADGEAAFTLLFGRPLTNFEKVLLTYVSTSQGFPSRLIPKTVGVRANYGEFVAGNYFGFQGAPGADGFGEFNGTFGYGLGYGVGYGDSDYSLVAGGFFATLY
jgi:hypothetical protein